MKKLINKIKNWLLRRKITIFMVAGLGIFFDLFFIDFVFDLMIFFLTCLWLLVIWLYHLPSKISLNGGLVFLAFCPLFLIFSQELIAGKFTVWAIMFLGVGITQMVIEYVKEEKKNIQK